MQVNWSSRRLFAGFVSLDVQETQVRDGGHDGRPTLAVEWLRKYVGSVVLILVGTAVSTKCYSQRLSQLLWSSCVAIGRFMRKLLW